MNILLNLPPAFHAQERFAPAIARLREIGELRQASHNTHDEIADDLAWADAVLMWSWPILERQHLEAAGGVRFLGHIDIDPAAASAALAAGIPVSLAKRAWAPAVAELALGALIGRLRRIPDHSVAMRAGTETWGGLWPEDVDPRERSLSEVQVGIVGFGGVGRRLRALLAPFGTRVAIHDPYIDPSVASEADVTPRELDDLVATCDALVLCAAANEGTRALLDAERIARLSQDAVVINVARGTLIDTDALVARLQRGEISAHLDVFDQEPLPADHPLRDCANAWLTPHRAGGILASGNRILDLLIEDLLAASAGRPLAHGLTQDQLVALDG